MNVSTGGGIIAATTAIFVIDLFTPLGFAEPMLYVLPILLTGLLPSQQSTPLTVGSAVLLTWIGAAFSPGEWTSEAVANRTMTTVMLVTFGWLLLIHKRSVRQISEVQQARAESEERLRLFIEHAPAALAMFDREMCYLAVSTRWLEDYSLDDTPLLGRSHYEIFPDIPDRWKEVHRRGLAGEIVREEEDRFDRADGSVHWIRWEVRPWRRYDGQIGGIVIFAEDITERKRAETALRTSEARFRTMAEAVPSFLFETDAAGWNIWTSEVWYRFTGQTPDQVAGHGWAEALHPDDRAANLDQWLHCMEHGIPFEAKQRLRRAEGGYAWVIARALPVRDDYGQISRWVGSVTDVDVIMRAEEQQRQLNDTLERRIAERTEALRESEERFRGIFEHAGEGIAITDLEGRFVQCNTPYTAIVGYTEHELSTMQFESLIHQDDRPQNMELVRRLVNGELPSFELENRYLAKSGATIWVHKHGSMLRNDRGEATHLMVLATDISHRKRIEAALHTVQARQQLLLTATPVVLYSCRMTGNYGTTFISENVREQLGYRAEDFTADSDFWLTHLHPDDRPWILANLAQKPGRDRQVQEYRFLHQDGTYRWLHDESRLIRDEDGIPRELIGFQIDITERKQAEDLLLRQQAQLEDLAAQLLMAQEQERRRIARELHDDITQRIAALAIDLQSMRLARCESPLSLSQRLHDLGVLAERLTTDVQRMAHQLHPSILEHVGLDAAVREHAEEFEGRTGLKTEVVVRALPEKIPLDQATCLYRVLQESLQNVRKHANATAILIRLVKTGRGIGLSVHDDGQGFEQVSGVIPPKGLGLTSMAERVKALQGGFRARTKPGDGTEIHAWVPIESQEASQDMGPGA